MRAYTAFWYMEEQDRVKLPTPLSPVTLNSPVPGMGYAVSHLPNDQAAPIASTSSSAFGNAPPLAIQRQGSTRAAADSSDEIHPSWIALLLSLMSLSLERMGWQEARQLRIVESLEEFLEMTKGLSVGAQRILELSDYMTVRRLEVIQAMLVYSLSCCA